MTELKSPLIRMLACMAATLCLHQSTVAAETGGESYPQRPIRIVVGFGAGTAIDTVARMLSEHLAAATRQPVIVENKPGANSTIAAAQVAQSAADGYTLLLASNTSHAANSSLMKKLPYDPVADFAPVGRVASIPFILAAGPSMAATSIAQLVGQSRSNPGRFSYASSNSGSLVAGALLSQAAGIELRHIPYKSSPQAIADVMAGHVDLIFVDPLAAGPHISAGKLRPLGVTSQNRIAQLPEVPSMVDELGGVSMVAWYALFAPKATSPAVVNRLNKELLQFLGTPAVTVKLVRLGVSAWPSDPQTLKTFIQREIEAWGAIVHKAGIEPE